MTDSLKKTPLGFIGLGLMGKPMTMRLLNAGHQVAIWNRDHDKLKQIDHPLAVKCDSFAEVAKYSEVIMICVTDTDAVRNVVFGSPMNSGLAHFLKPGHTIVDFSSIEPDATRDIAKTLKGQIGCHWVDAPVSGGVIGAERGTLSIMAGGDSQVIDNLRPTLSALSQQVTRMGPVGSGQATKICNQMIVSCNVMVLAEALALAERSGVDATLIPEALKGGFADSLPLQITGTRMVEKEFDEIKWTIKTLHKDLTMAAQLAKHCGSDIPVSQLAKGLMEKSKMTDLDPANLIRLYEEKNSAHK